jgi:hypothetical protein
MRVHYSGSIDRTDLMQIRRRRKICNRDYVARTEPAGEDEC